MAFKGLSVRESGFKGDKDKVQDQVDSSQNQTFANSTATNQRIRIRSVSRHWINSLSGDTFV